MKFRHLKYLAIFFAAIPTGLPAQCNVSDTSFFLSTSDATGPRYRKLGLNGFPIPDKKPQAKAETDEEPEETYIDAFNHNLTHQVTDVYIPMQGSDLTLTVRRNWSSEVWNTMDLQPRTSRPDLPFGPGWRANLGASLKLVAPFGPPAGKEPGYAYVTDTNGATFRFIVLGDSTGGRLFFPMPSNRFEQEVMATKLVQNGTGFVFTNKYGTRLNFGPLGGPGDVLVSGFTVPESSPPEGTIYRWARLLTASDRYGTTMTYTFGESNTTIVPDSISCRGKTITIAHSGGRVTSITDPRGKTTQYEYTPTTEMFSGSLPNTALINLAPSLTKVKRADNSETNYLYEVVTEPDRKPRPFGDLRSNNVYGHLDIKSITDPNGHAYTFNYAFDLTRKAYSATEEISGWYTPSGNPRQITSVALPGGYSSTFTNSSELWMEVNSTTGALTPKGTRKLGVIDAKGGVWTYDFTEPTVSTMDEFAEMIFPDFDPENPSIALMLFYSKMTVSTPETKTFVATFDPGAGGALASLKDVDASVATTFEYADPIDLASIFSWASPEMVAAMPIVRWGDPTKQTDGLGNAKYFTYSGTWRIMSQVKDEKERVTKYEIDPGNGNRTKEEIFGAGGSLAQRTDFEYHNDFPGIMTKKTVNKGSGDPGWATDLVTSYGVENGTGNKASETKGGSTTHYGYDANNNKTSVIDPRGNETEFEYDDLNRLHIVNLPGGASKTLNYDARGNKTSEVDENGHTTRWEYDGLNRVVKQKREMSGGNLVTEYAYDALNAKISATDPRGNTTTFQYDGLKRLTDKYEPLGVHTSYVYGLNSGGLQFGKDFLPTQVTNPRGFKTTTIYDAANRPTQTTVEVGSSSTAVTHFAYDKVGNLTSQTDPLNKTTTKDYNALNLVTKTTFADNQEINEFYTQTGLKWKVVDELGKDTLMEYDNQGRQVKVSSPLVPDGAGFSRAVTTTHYDDADNVTETINPRGFSWTYEYDSRNRKRFEHRPGTGSPTVEWQYDAVGNVRYVIDPRGATTETKYDENNRPWKVIQPSVPIYPTGTASPTTITEYDENGNVTKVTDANGHDTVNVYDELNRLTSTTDAEGITVSNEYDKSGNKTAVIDGKNQRTGFAYDGLNRNTKVTDAAGKSTTFEYDEVNKTARVDAMGQRTTYSYDDRHRLTHVSYVGHPEHERDYSYDLVGNLLAVTEPYPLKNGAANVIYTYDALKRVMTETSSGLTHVYKYDLAGNRTSCLYGGLTVPLISTYDAQNRLETLTQGANVTTYTYDLNGNMLTRMLPNGDVTTSTYDAANRTGSMVGTNGGSVALYSYVYGYDELGNVRCVTESYGNAALNRVVTNAYDGINRLVEEAVAGAGGVMTTYEYDDANNRISMVKSGTTTNYTYNNLNQITQFSSGTNTTTFTYDDNGNRIWRLNPSESVAYIWDCENRLIQAGGNRWGDYILGYDYRGRRYWIQAESAWGVTSSFSGGVAVREMAIWGTTSVDYIRGSDYGGGVGGILYTIRSGTASFTHNNRRGDIVAKTDGAGTVTYQATYEAFGKRATETGSTLDRQKSNSKDEDIPGYANEGFRFRDLETGTFLSRDPAGFVDGPNLYAYVNQNPWTKFDPEGLNEALVLDTFAQGATQLLGRAVVAAAVVPAAMITGYGAFKALQNRAQTAKSAQAMHEMGTRNFYSRMDGVQPTALPGATIGGVKLPDSLPNPIAAPPAPLEGFSPAPSVPTGAPGFSPKPEGMPNELITTPGGETAQGIITLNNGNLNTWDGEILEPDDLKDLSIRREGVIYKTQDPYIGSTLDLEQRDAWSTDGIDRSNAKILDTFIEGDNFDRFTKERRELDNAGGLEKTKNKILPPDPNKVQ